MKRLLTSIFAGGIVFGLVAAFAATLDVDSGGLGAATVAVTSCDADGVTLSYDTEFGASGYELTAMTVSGIDPACTAISVKFAGQEFTKAGPAAAETFTLTTPVSAATFEGPVDVVVSS